MARRGLVERLDCPKDRRASSSTLTDSGRTAVEAAAPGHVEAVRRRTWACDRQAPRRAGRPKPHRQSHFGLDYRRMGGCGQTR